MIQDRPTVGKRSTRASPWTSPAWVLAHPDRWHRRGRDLPTAL